MTGLSDGVVSEAVELSEAVFSDGRESFEDSYDGEIDDYMLIQDLRNRIDEAMMDTDGKIPYMDDLPSFSDLGHDEDSWARVFYSLTPDTSYRELADVSEFSVDSMSNVIGGLKDEGLIEATGTTRSKKYFYGEKALPYLMLLSEAEMILEDGEADTFSGERSQEVEPEVEQEPDLDVNRSDSEVPEEAEDSSEPVDEEDDKSLREIMKDVADDDEDFRTTFSRKEDGGIEQRDHTDTETDESSNPSEDEYYEGW